MVPIAAPHRAHGIGDAMRGSSATIRCEYLTQCQHTILIASAQGVPSVTVTTADELVDALRRSYATPGPMFIEAMMPKGLG